MINKICLDNYINIARYGKDLEREAIRMIYSYEETCSCIFYAVKQKCDNSAMPFTSHQSLHFL